MKVLLKQFISKSIEFLDDDDTYSISEGICSFFQMFALIQKLNVLFLNLTDYDMKLHYMKELMKYLSLEKYIRYDIYTCYIVLCCFLLVSLCQIFVSLPTASCRYIQKSLKRSIYYYMSSFQLLFPLQSMTIATQHLISNSIHSIIISAITLLLVLLQYAQYFYIQRNVQIPVQNHLKRRYNPAAYLHVAFDFLLVFFSFYTFQPQLSVVFFIIDSLFSLFEALFYMPYSFNCNQSYTRLSLVQLIVSLFTLAYQLTTFSPDQYFYYLLIFIPLLIPLIDIPTRNPLQLADLLHHYDKTMQKNSSYFIYWYMMATKHMKTCNNHPNSNREIVKCILEQNTYSNSQRTVISNDQNFLTMINYMLYQCEIPLEAYIRLKSYNSVSKSVFFAAQEQILIVKTSHYVILQQSIKTKNIVSKNLEQQGLQIYQLKDAEQFWNWVRPQVVRIVEMKMLLWHNLLNGFRNIEKLNRQVQSLAKSIWELKEELRQQMGVDVGHMHLGQLNAIQLRLLSLVQSTIFNDYLATLEIEDTIQEILVVERNIHTEKILNTCILNDQVVVLVISLLKSKSHILNPNRKSVAQFFGYEGDRDYDHWKSINSLMPKFISSIHNTLVENYIQKGYSKFMIIPRHIYILNSSGYIESANLQIANIFDSVDDFLMTGAILKKNELLEIILFDLKGKILGLSHNISQILFTSSKKIDGAYIQFWMPYIADLIKENLEDLQNEENSYTTKEIRRQLYESPNISQMIGETNLIKVSEQREKRVKDQIEGHDILMIEEQFSTYFTQRSEKYSSREQMVTFTISYRNIGFESAYPFFELQVHDIKDLKNTNKSMRSIGHPLESKTPIASSDELNSQEEQFQLNFNLPIVNKLAPIDSFLSFNQVLLQEQMIVLQDHNNNLEQGGGQGEEQGEEQGGEQINPQIQSNRQENSNKLISNESDEDKEDKEENVKSSTVKNRKNLKEIFEQNKELQVLENCQQSQNSSRTSNTSGGAYSLLKNITFNKKMPIYLTKLILINAFLLSFLLFCIILAIEMSSQHIDQLKQDVFQIQLPSQLNQFYVKLVLQGQIEQSIQLNMSFYDDFYKKRNLHDLAINKVNMNNLLIKLRLTLTQIEKSNKIKVFDIFQVTDNDIFVEGISLILWKSLLQDHSYQLATRVVGSDQNLDVIELLHIYFFKFNLLNNVKVSKSLVDAVSDLFFQKIIDFEEQSITILCIQILVIIVLVIIQYPFWRRRYFHQQQTLLGITRTQALDAEIEINKQRILSFIHSIISRLKQLKEILNQDLHWKKINYATFNYIDKYQTSKVVQRTTLTTRIQYVQFKQTSIYCILAFTLILNTLFLGCGYLYRSQNQSQTNISLRLTMNFVKFKHALDTQFMLAISIKTDYMVDERIMDLFPQNRKFNEEFLAELYQNQTEYFVRDFQVQFLNFDNIYAEILASDRMKEDDKQVLLQLYSGNLCRLFEKELPFCSYQDGKFKHFPFLPPAQDRDNYEDIVTYGITGIVQSFQKAVKTYFSEELTTNKHSRQQPNANHFVFGDEFSNLFVAYIKDLYYPFARFELLMEQASVSILQEDFLELTLYYSLAGVSCILITFTVMYLYGIRAYREILAVRQALVLIPYNSLRDVQTINALKRMNQL